MKKATLLLLSYTLIVVCLGINIACNAVWWFVFLPKTFIEMQRRGLKYFLVWLPEFIREDLKIFDVYGLRHNSHYLGLSTTRNKVAMMNVQQQCDYADQVTRNTFTKSGKMVEVAGVGGMFIEEPTIGIMSQQLEGMNISGINTTGIGNLAWISQYYPDPIVKEMAIRKLQEIREYFSTFS